MNREYTPTNTLQNYVSNMTLDKNNGVYLSDTETPSSSIFSRISYSEEFYMSYRCLRIHWQFFVPRGLRPNHPSKDYLRVGHYMAYMIPSTCHPAKSVRLSFVVKCDVH